jgi:hypothetical protein
MLSPARDHHDTVPADSYSENGAIGIAGIWLVFYLVIGVATAAGNWSGLASFAAIN